MSSNARSTYNYIAIVDRPEKGLLYYAHVSNNGGEVVCVILQF